jgi:hypothetical protein
MGYHGLLDWRLGLSILRILADSSYRCGLDGELQLPELDGWLQQASVLRDMFCGAFQCRPAVAGPLPAVIVRARRVIIKHPLWDHLHPVGLLADAIASMPENLEYSFLDTFNVLRRPSSAYLSLLR